MSIQLIICVEANNISKSDFMYIKSTIQYFYEVDSTIHLVPVYMGGKSHYNSRKIKNSIESSINQFKAMNKDSRNYVLYCFDCDRYDQNNEDKAFLESVRKYCDENNYCFVWFCRDIEQVYLGESITSEKGKEAVRFMKKELIKTIDPAKLSAEKYQMKRSNICRILDRILTRKHN